MVELLSIELKTKKITFDDRLQQVRIIKRVKSGFFGAVTFLNYLDDDGFRYLKKYRPDDWDKVIVL